MRLALEKRLTPIQKLFLRGLRLLLKDTPGPALVTSYRKSYFGNNWIRCMKEGMRKAKHWRVGEVELFAAFISKVNSCSF